MFSRPPSLRTRLAVIAATGSGTRDVRATVREAGHGLPGHPADLRALPKDGVPMIAYGNGADWFDYVLRGDARAGARFVGPGCGLCGEPEWTVGSKGLSL